MYFLSHFISNRIQIFARTLVSSTRTINALNEVGEVCLVPEVTEVPRAQVCLVEPGIKVMLLLVYRVNLSETVELEEDLLHFIISNCVNIRYVY